MARVWVEYGYTMATPCQVLAYTLGRACQKERLAVLTSDSVWTGRI